MKTDSVLRSTKIKKIKSPQKRGQAVFLIVMLFVPIVHWFVFWLYVTGNILNLSKLENQKSLPNQKNFNLAEQIRKTILMLESEWAAKNISFDLVLPDVQYCGDMGILFHVWYNLIGNAIKYSEQNCTVRIELRTVLGKIYVTVEDYGCGIGAEALPHIFEKFYQEDTSHSAEGNGLGLALVKRIVTLCNGEILVKSEPKNGTAFTVILPAQTGNEKS